MSKVVIVSGDGHATPQIPTILKYVDPAYRGHMDGLIREELLYLETRAAPARPSVEALSVFDDRGLVGAGGEYGSLDAEIRIEQMDAEGIAAEIVHVGTQNAQMPFFGVTNSAWPDDVRAAGAKAYHRWLADFSAAMDGRIYGVAEPGPCKNLDATIAELEWCAANSFVSVSAPGNTVDAELPDLLDAYWDPFWAAAADLGLVISMHAGWGAPQMPMSTWRQSPLGMMMDQGEDVGVGKFEIIHKMMQQKGSPIRIMLATPRRAWWKLMAGGVFDRHPGLKVAMTEIRADWVPETLAYLDERFADLQLGCARKPSEYFREHCLVVPSSPHKCEVEMRHSIGVEQFGFGQDYPHWEGVWPNTLNWLQDAFGKIPEAELRAILGGNLIRFYGLDEAKLTAIADRIGPTVTDILGDHPVADELLQNFNQRSGYLRSADPVFPDEIEDLLKLDLAPLTG
jgi:predicted TIM-barrel fold metal-dependent hydrolase